MIPIASANWSIETGFGAVHVDGTLGFGVVDREKQDSARVVDVDPGHDLLARADRSADVESKWTRHLRERAAASAENDAEARVHDAHPQRGHTRFGLLPFLREKREVVAAAGVDSSTSSSAPRPP